MSLSDLKQQLDIAVSEESFSEAARLRDRIQEISHDMHAAVDYANTRFYESFKNADNDAMAAVWGDGDSVQCIHPGMAALVGVSVQPTCLATVAPSAVHQCLNPSLYLYGSVIPL